MGKGAKNKTKWKHLQLGAPTKVQQKVEEDVRVETDQADTHPFLKIISKNLDAIIKKDPKTDTEGSSSQLIYLYKSARRIPVSDPSDLTQFKGQPLRYSCNAPDSVKKINNNTPVQSAKGGSQPNQGKPPKTPEQCNRGGIISNQNNTFRTPAQCHTRIKGTAYSSPVHCTNTMGSPQYPSNVPLPYTTEVTNTSNTYTSAHQPSLQYVYSVPAVDQYGHAVQTGPGGGQSNMQYAYNSSVPVLEDPNMQYSQSEIQYVCSTEQYPHPVNSEILYTCTPDPHYNPSGVRGPTERVNRPPGDQQFYSQNPVTGELQIYQPPSPMVYSPETEYPPAMAQAPYVQYVPYYYYYPVPVTSGKPMTVPESSHQSNLVSAKCSSCLKDGSLELMSQVSTSSTGSCDSCQASERLVKRKKRKKKERMEQEIISNPEEVDSGYLNGGESSSGLSSETERSLNEDYLPVEFLTDELMNEESSALKSPEDTRTKYIEEDNVEEVEVNLRQKDTKEEHADDDEKEITDLLISQLQNPGSIDVQFGEVQEILDVLTKEKKDSYEIRDFVHSSEKVKEKSEGEHIVKYNIDIVTEDTFEISDIGGSSEREEDKSEGENIVKSYVEVVTEGCQEKNKTETCSEETTLILNNVNLLNINQDSRDEPQPDTNIFKTLPVMNKKSKKKKKKSHILPAIVSTKDLSQEVISSQEQLSLLLESKTDLEQVRGNVEPKWTEVRSSNPKKRGGKKMNHSSNENPQPNFENKTNLGKVDDVQEDSNKTTPLSEVKSLFFEEKVVEIIERPTTKEQSINFEPSTKLRKKNKVKKSITLTETTKDLTSNKSESEGKMNKTVNKQENHNLPILIFQPYSHDNSYKNYKSEDRLPEAEVELETDDVLKQNIIEERKRAPQRAPAISNKAPNSTIRCVDLGLNLATSLDRQPPISVGGPQLQGLQPLHSGEQVLLQRILSSSGPRSAGSSCRCCRGGLHPSSSLTAAVERKVILVRDTNTVSSPKDKASSEAKKGAQSQNQDFPGPRLKYSPGCRTGPLGITRKVVPPQSIISRLTVF